MNHTIDLKDDNKCWSCGKKMDAATTVNQQRGPQAGDYGICFYCGSFLKFVEDGRTVKLVDGEFESLPEDQQFEMKRIQTGLQRFIMRQKALRN